jgi:hypothetical protein
MPYSDVSGLASLVQCHCLAKVGCALPGYSLPAVDAVPERSLAACDDVCELCGSEIDTNHSHLLERRSQRLLCSCTLCAALFQQGGLRRYRRVPARVASLPPLRTAELDASCRVPFEAPWPVTFFSPLAWEQRVAVVRAGPERVLRSWLGLRAWQQLSAVNPLLEGLETEVEALLVYRTNDTCTCLRLPIDRCFQLIGLLRQCGDSGTRILDILEIFVERLCAEAVVESGEPYS